jgi:hypothetical protein
MKVDEIRLNPPIVRYLNCIEIALAILVPGDTRGNKNRGIWQWITSRKRWIEAVRQYSALKGA